MLVWNILYLSNKNSKYHVKSEYKTLEAEILLEYFHIKGIIFYSNVNFAISDSCS